MRCTIFRRISQFCRQLFDDNKTVIAEPLQDVKSELSLGIIPRNAHSISRKDISENALKVLYRLHKSGFKAYLVGGGVRDLLLGSEPKDFDVVTNATPEEIKGLFRNSRLVGRRFRLAHIIFGRDVIEVATFRGHHRQGDDKISKVNAEGRLLRDNVYGSIDEDAERRDFTVNALYYDISDFSIHSYAGGKQDIENRVLRLIGDPQTRYREDPVRMIRAIRFATKLDMDIEENTLSSIKPLAPLLADIPPARMFEEVLKLFFHGKALANYRLMQEHDLFGALFPILNRATKDDPKGMAARMIKAVMESTDHRVSQDKPISPSFFYGALLWYPLQQKAQEIAHESGLSLYDAFFTAMGDILDEQCRTIGIPKRFTVPTRDIWQMQLRFERSQNPKAFKLMEHPKFRAAYDLLLLRSQVEKGHLLKTVDWWTNFVNGDDEQKTLMVKASKKAQGYNKNQRRRRRNPKSIKKASNGN